jgi:hypothetical protein
MRSQLDPDLHSGCFGYGVGPACDDMCIMRLIQAKRSSMKLRLVEKGTCRCEEGWRRTAQSSGSNMYARMVTVADCDQEVQRQDMVRCERVDMDQKTAQSV